VSPSRSTRRASSSSAPAVRSACRQFVRLSAVEPFRRIRQLRRVRQRIRALGDVFNYRNLGAHPRPVVQDPFAFLWQSPGAGALRRQAALHDGAGPAHDRDDRQRRQPPVQIAWASSRRWCRSTKVCCSRTRPPAPIKDGVLWPSWSRSMRRWPCSRSSMAECWKRCASW